MSASRSSFFVCFFLILSIFGWRWAQSELQTVYIAKSVNAKHIKVKGKAYFNIKAVKNSVKSLSKSIAVHGNSIIISVQKKIVRENLLISSSISSSAVFSAVHSFLYLLQLF